MATKKETVESETVAANLPLFKTVPVKKDDDFEQATETRIRKRVRKDERNSEKNGEKTVEKNNAKTSKPALKSRNAKARTEENDSASQTEQVEEKNEFPKKVRSRKDRNKADRSKIDRNMDRDDKKEQNNASGFEGSTRVEAKKQRRKDNREIGRRRQIITEAEFLAKRENVERKMIIRDQNGSQQIAVLEDGILVEHYVSEQSEASVVGNVYLGKVQNVLPGMEAAFVDIGEGRNAVLYAGEVNWDASELADSEPRRIEQVLSKGDSVLVQVTKDPIGAKGARLTSQVTFAGKYLVLVPSKGINGISRKLSDRERGRLKDVLSQFSKEEFSIIVRTAASGVSDEELVADILRLKKKWEEIQAKAKKAKAPELLHGETELSGRVIRDAFNTDFKELIVSGDEAFDKTVKYIEETTPELLPLVQKWTKKTDVFDEFRVDEQLAKALDRKVWLPSGGTLVIDRTEAMTVIDINTGKFTGNNKATSLEETVTKNNLEAAEEIVNQLRLRDIGGIVVIDFIDMVLAENREAVLRRLLECLSRDRTKHQVAEVTSLGLVQLTRKRVGQGLIEAFSTTCELCAGRGYVVHSEPVVKDINAMIQSESPEGWHDNFVGASHELEDGTKMATLDDDAEKREANKRRLAAIAAAAGV